MNKKSGLADNPLFFNNPPLAGLPNEAAFPAENNSSPRPENGLVPPIMEGEQVNTRTPERLNTSTGAQANTRTPEHPNRRTDKRQIERNSYNIYRDQHQALLRIEAESRLSGKTISKSVLVRQALDQFIKRYRT